MNTKKNYKKLCTLQFIFEKEVQKVFSTSLNHFKIH